MKLDAALQKFGLTRREALLYLAALELGSAPVQKIAEKSGLVRSTAYEVLERLRFKGLVSTFLKKKIRYYSAEDPRHVINFAESQVTTLKEALPELEAIAGRSRGQPSVRFYEGSAGVRIILQEILAEANKICAFGMADDLFREIPDFPKFFVAERMRKKIPIRIIHLDTPKARERQKLGPRELREVRLLNRPLSYHGIIYIWKNKIAHISFKDGYTGIITESKDIADMQRAWFESLWERLH